jgi:hypothetical protein
VLFTVKAAILIGLWDHWIHNLTMMQAKQFGLNWPNVFREDDLQVIFCYHKINLHIQQKNSQNYKFHEKLLDMLNSSLV